MRQADAVKIKAEIDTDMIHAAVHVLSNWDNRFGDLQDLAKDIFEAALAAVAIKGS